MDIFDKVILDNTVRIYTIVGCTIFVAVLIKKYISRYIASVIYSFAKRYWSGIDKNTFTGLVTDPLKWFLFVLVTVFSIDKLNFPHQIEFKIYGHEMDEIVARLGTAAIIVSFIWLLLRLIDFIAVLLKQKAAISTETKNHQLVIFIRDFLKVIIALCGVLLIIKACFNQHIGNLFTGLSIVGAAMALAAKESLENLIASFIIFFDKPFFSGDVVNVNSITGTVERIGLRSTRIRTADKTLVTVPNKQMVDTIVDNWSMRTNRRAEIKLELPPKTLLQSVESFIEAAKKVLQTKKHITSFTVFLKEVSKNSLTIMMEYFTEPFSLNEFNELKEEINIAVMNLLKENNIDIAPDAAPIILKEKA